MKSTGIVTGIISNLVTVEVNGHVSQNEICYIDLGGTKLMAEVIKISEECLCGYMRAHAAQTGDTVEFAGHMHKPPWVPDFSPAVLTGFRITSKQWRIYF